MQTGKGEPDIRLGIAALLGLGLPGLGFRARK